MPKIHFFALAMLFFSPAIFAQYDGAAGTAGSAAIYKNDFRFRGWATGCTAQIGAQDINQPTLGQAASGSNQATLGRAGDGQVLSLGDGGQATLSFQNPIFDGDDIDFVVFENGFSDTFLELAFVEVSSDGLHFFRFPAVSNSDTLTQIGTFGAVNPVHLYNFAGKYRANYGVGFDLSELLPLADSTLDLNAIRFVRVIDVVGALEGAQVSRDSRGHKINDPYPTPFATGGFDLDAVGVFNSQSSVALAEFSPAALTWQLCSSQQIPLYQSQMICLENQNNIANTDIHYIWLDAAGRVLTQGRQNSNEQLEIYTPNFSAAGQYYLMLQTAEGRQTLVFLAN